MPEINVEQPADAQGQGGGIRMERVKGELTPPPQKENFSSDPGEEFHAPTGQPHEQPKEVVRKRLPIKRGMIAPGLRFKGHIQKEIFGGWDGWLYSEEDIDDICEMVEALGIEAPAAAQLAVTLLGLEGAKWMGYLAWKKQKDGKSAVDESIMEVS